MRKPPGVGNSNRRESRQRPTNKQHEDNMYRTYTADELERACWVDPANVAAVREMSARYLDMREENTALQERVDELEQEIENLDGC
ncbi:hypothetical protein [Ralstonia mannitolilytica]|uniref:hypothetical protein n=1 Tax=Ralstonia mannitolilytica TaxID=105219 RepID=UPI0012E968D2|nr:hypothetical protein [Ralstonia mannitolilytica]